MLIGELAEKTGLSTSTIRFYEKKGLMPEPHRGRGNYRHYGEADLRQIRRIQTGQRLGLSLKVVRGLVFVNAQDNDRRTLQQVELRLLEVEALQARLAEQRQSLLVIHAALERSVSGEQPFCCAPP